MFKALRKEHPLPYRGWWPFCVGIACGILMRIVFWGGPGTLFSAMGGSFIYFMPLLVGAVTVYMAEKQARRSWVYYWTAPFVSTCFVVIGTLLIMIEGLICAIVIVPMFAVMGGIGGLIMGAICRFTNWPKRTLYSLGALPFVGAVVFAHIPFAPQIDVFERSVLIHAPAERVWAAMTETTPIAARDMEQSWAMRIGVPPPERGAMRMENGERLRRSQWGKSVYFDEVMTHWQPHESLVWKYRFYPDSFPKHALDDHVEIGGHYFDLLQTEFTLTPQGDSIMLTTRTHYRVSTHFNFYANWVAKIVIGDLAEHGLKLFKARSEK
jgi:uncharacterized protein YndB with AHSA1/START domain